METANIDLEFKEATIETFEEKKDKGPTEIINYTDLYEISVENLNKWLDKKFYITIPRGLETISDMQEAGRLLGQLSNDYAYLAMLLSYAKMFVRAEKRKGKDFKASYEDMIDKRDIIDEMTSVVKMQYQAISRMITVKQEIQEELNMSKYQK